MRTLRMQTCSGVSESGEARRPLDEKKEKMLTEAPAPPNAAVTATAPATTTSPAEPPLLTAPDGTRYFGGQTELRAIDASGKETLWPLPGEAVGSLPHPALFRIAEQAGPERTVRI